MERNNLDVVERRETAQHSNFHSLVLEQSSGILTLSMRDQLSTSESDDCRRQILTSKVDIH